MNGFSYHVSMATNIKKKKIENQTQHCVERIYHHHSLAKGSHLSLANPQILAANL